MQPRDLPFLGAVIGGAGGDVMGSMREFLKFRGVFVNYVMISMEQLHLFMQAVIKTLEQTEFGEMMRLVAAKKLGWWKNM